MTDTLTRLLRRCNLQKEMLGMLSVVYSSKSCCDWCVLESCTKGNCPDDKYHRLKDELDKLENAND